jgi:hypothetical protein
MRLESDPKPPSEAVRNSIGNRDSGGDVRAIHSNRDSVSRFGLTSPNRSGASYDAVLSDGKMRCRSEKASGERGFATVPNITAHLSIAYLMPGTLMEVSRLTALKFAHSYCDNLLLQRHESRTYH